MFIIMKHDIHGHCFAYNQNEIDKLKSLGWYEKQDLIADDIPEIIKEIPTPQVKKTAKNRRK